ncbi:hypothetical protein CspHIS471_0407260 [Cutaneotrichosporon sp. HIS471]|nr:hypothetical protein CspHIS471_0407260 [Cutaneotrichosporon sp. HIS471]
MLPLLLAAVAVAATTPKYAQVNYISPFSPFIHYSSRPVLVGPDVLPTPGNGGTTPPGPPWTQHPLNDPHFESFVDKGWTALDLAEWRNGNGISDQHVISAAVGSSFSYSVPRDFNLFLNTWSINATLDVEVNGTRVVSHDSQPGVYHREHEPPYNFTATLRSGKLGLIGVTLVPYAWRTDEWEEVEAVWAASGSNVTRSGNWRNATRKDYPNYPESSTSGDRISIALQKGTRFVKMLGYSNGSYEVNCTPTPLYTSGTTYSGFTELEVMLYVASLDVSKQYTLELINHANTTGITSLLTRQQKKKPRNLSPILGWSLGLGIPAALVIVAVAIWWYKKRQARSEDRKQMQSSVETGVPPKSKKLDAGDEDDDAPPFTQ